MTHQPFVPIRSVEGRELVRDNILSFGNNPMNSGFVAIEGRYGKLAPIESDVHFYDSINQGLATMQPYQYISWSRQPERRASMYNVIHAQITDKTAGAIPFANGSNSLQDYLSGAS